ncbi:MAG: magnesium/cobalt transporter CorA [Coriobacteriia bacterium]|nr:magnesium/cobalt transporter CorA [Coriobacteriia bacterium]
MSEILVRWLDEGGAVRSAGAEVLPLSEASSWVWVDVTDPDVAVLDHLADVFGLHPLVVEDMLHAQHRAKFDVYPNGAFLAWLTPDHRRGEGVATRELDVFVGNTCLLTLHHGVDEAIEKVAKDAERVLQAGPDWLMHAIVDLLVDSTLPLVDAMGEELSAIEDTMLDNPRQDDLKRLHKVRRQLVRMHRIVAPERDIIRGIGRERGANSGEIYRYFQDVGDHLGMVLDSIETYQDVGASVMDVYLSAQNNRMNLIMKQLTVVATIFMPLTLLSGIYGMNITVKMWPPSDAWWSFPAVVGFMWVVAIAMGIYFRRKKWW